MTKILKGKLYLAIWIVSLAGLISCSNRVREEEVSEKPVAVTVSGVIEGSRPAIMASGKVEAVQTANISTRVMGRITNIYVKMGDRVKKGQLLATVWDDDIKAKRAQAEAMIAEAEGALHTAGKDYDRFNNLYRQQSATARELDNVTLQYNSAKARLSAARQLRGEVNANLSYSRLTAPFSGVVTQKFAEVGSIVNPGMPLLTVEHDEVLQVSASIAESDISQVHLGDAVNVEIKSTGNRFEGRIMQINPSSHFTGGQYIVKISIPEAKRQNIYAGMFASISIPVKETPHEKKGLVLVPLSAIISRDGLTGIYTVSENHRALLRWIRLGNIYGDKAEVISGLSKADKFILSSEARLYNGTPVVVKEIPEAAGGEYKQVKIEITQPDL